MRWAISITAISCLALAAYMASPLVALHHIASAVEARNAGVLEERIDFPSVRRSFRKQIQATYRRLTGKPLPLGAMARRFAISVADPVVARLMTINALLDLLGQGKVTDEARVPRDRAPFASRSFDSAWRLWLNADYLGRNFYVSLPPEGPRRFRVQLRLSNWHWRIVSIELPEELLEELARELVDVKKERRDAAE